MAEGEPLNTTYSKVEILLAENDIRIYCPNFTFAKSTGGLTIWGANKTQISYYADAMYGVA